jgi:hypothetical protein
MSWRAVRARLINSMDHNVPEQIGARPLCAESGVGALNLNSEQAKFLVLATRRQERPTPTRVEFLSVVEVRLLPRSLQRLPQSAPSRLREVRASSTARASRLEGVAYGRSPGLRFLIHWHRSWHRTAWERLTSKNIEAALSLDVFREKGHG